MNAIRTRMHGRAGLIVPAILLAVAIHLLIGQMTMRVAEDADLAGPKFAAWIVIGLLVTLAVLRTIALIRRPEPKRLVDADGVRHRWYSDWSRLAWAIGGFVGCIALMLPLGWIFSGALLFWCMTRALASPRPALDVLVSLAFSSLLYLLFAGLLGVNLPSGSLLSIGG